MEYHHYFYDKDRTNPIRSLMDYVNGTESLKEYCSKVLNYLLSAYTVYS